VDPSPEMAEVLAAELSRAGLRARATSLEAVRADPAQVKGALTVSLPYHVRLLHELCPGATIEEVTLQVAPAVQAAIEALPLGAIVLVVTHSPSVLPFARKYLDSARGDELVAQAHLLADPDAWRRLLPAAHLVLTDALSTPILQRARPKRLQEFCFLSDEVLARIREALALVSPPVSR